MNGKANFVVMLVIVMCLAVFIYGALEVNESKRQIAELIDDQSPLIFAFENTGQSGRITFVVTCNRVEEPDGKYVCTTKQTEPVVATVAVPTITPAPTTTPVPIALTATPQPRP